MRAGSDGPVELRYLDELPVAYYNSNLMRLEFDPLQVASNGVC